MNSFERMPMPTPEDEASEKKENFADFDLQVGDRLYDNAGNYKEVLKIVELSDDVSFQEGTVYVRQYIDGEPAKQIEDMLFTEFVHGQDTIADIDQPRLPEGKTLEDYMNTGRANAQRLQIETILKNPDSPNNDIAEALLAKSNLIREILSNQKQ